MKPRGRVHLMVLDERGRAIARRRAENTVLRRGAEIVARLFSGADGAERINRIQVGFASEAATAETTALTLADGFDASELRSPVQPSDFSLVLDRPGSIQVIVRALFRPIREIPDVTEAGLLAGDRLYNQVVFEPVTFRPGFDITFFWEIEFPFGH